MCIARFDLYSFIVDDETMRINAGPHGQQVAQGTDQQRILRRTRAGKCLAGVDTFVKFELELPGIVFTGTLHGEIGIEALLHVSGLGNHPYRKTALVGLRRQHKVEISRFFVIEDYSVHNEFQTVTAVRRHGQHRLVRIRQGDRRRTGDLHAAVIRPEHKSGHGMTAGHGDLQNRTQIAE